MRNLFQVHFQRAFFKNIICTLIFHHDFEEELEKYLSHGVDMEFILQKYVQELKIKSLLIW